MTHVSQHIHDAFPADAATISRLKTESAHFRTLAGQFETIDHEAAEAASGADPASEVRTELLKKCRLALLDEIGVIISESRCV